MNSIAILEAVNTSYVPFNGQQVLTAVAAGVTYVAMRQIVENIGIDGTGQSVKLRKMKGKFNCRDISMVAADGKIRKLLCLPLKKLNGWLFSINPEKVRADIRDKLIQYQEECFTVLHDYWTKGKAENPRGNVDKTSTDDRTPLRGLVNRIMGKTGIHYQPLYKMIHREFGVKHIDELTSRQVTEAMEYLAGKVLEGEFIGKQEELPAPNINLDMPLKVWYENCAALRKENPPRVKKPYQSADLNITPITFYGEGNWSPTMALVNRLEAEGHDLSACRIEVAVMRKIISKLNPVVQEVDAIRGRRTISLMRVIGEKGGIILS